MVHNIPAGWQVMTVEQIKATVDSAIAIGPFGSRMKADCYVPNGVCVIRGNNITDTKTLGGEYVHITEEKAAEFPGCRVNNGDLVFPHRGLIGHVGIITEAMGEKGIISSSLMKLTPNRQIADSLYLFYYFRSPQGKHELLKNASQVGTPGIATPLASLRSLNVILPPLKEQQAIAHILGSLDDKIELNRQTNATLEAMARALFKSWFVDFDPVRARAAGRQPTGMDAATAALFPNSFEPSPLGKVPKGWRVGPLPQFVAVNPPRVLHKGDCVPYVEMADLPTASGRITGWRDREYTSGSRFTNSDVLLARITPCLENGKTAIVDFLNDGQIGWGSTEFIVFSAKPPLTQAFVYCMARSEEFRTFAIQNMNGSSGRQRVPASCFGTYLLASPPAGIAEAFAQMTRPMFEAIKANDEEAWTLAAVREGLLPRLLSGELTTKYM